ncbi:DUF418 domain-containing protein [Actinopolymorpha alba]|uniref:DUF418 domain-containing protein n=1 Tax=Actinopolymorpha alba TaxID=533267 RepID=UPI00058BC9CF|nr:DUF418 domain-containing protein [Actinopolymorpha alba]
MSTAQRRIDVLDVLRGLAILGTLGTNIWIFTNVIGPPAVLDLPPVDSFAHAFEVGVRFLANGKALALLTLLFGVGLELQYRSAKRRGNPWPGWYLWRAGLLFVEGLLHYVLVFEFDVLMGYAVTSVIVAYLIGRSDRAVRVWMITVGSIHVAFVSLLTVAFALGQGAANTALIVPSRPDLFSHGSYLEQVADRLRLMPVYRLEAIFIVPLGIVLFLLGSRLMRAGVFENTAQGARLRTRLMILGLGIALPLNVLTAFSGPTWGLVDRYILPPIVALGLLGLVTRLVLQMGASQSPGILRTGLTSVGRTALSCYVFQNLAGTILCYGWGFGLAARFEDLRPWWVPAAWLGISAMFMTGATWWLRRFDRGPLELVWHWAYQAPQRARQRQLVDAAR